MSTFDTNGMVTGYKVNRPLNQYEQQHRFNIRQPSSTQPHYDLSLIKLNSTFVECVDKWFAMRGFLAMWGALFGGFVAYGLLHMPSIYFRGEGHELVGVLLMTFFSTLLAAFGYLFTRDAFTYTHYPIRFNRKNRQVYVFQRNGTVLKAGWEDIYWTIYGHNIGTHDLYVVGHVMGEDKTTVKETFALSTTEAGAPGEQNLRSLFEFFRRYMEEGPGPVLDALKPTPLIMLPGIDKEKESWRFGWEVLTLSLNGMLVLQVLMQIFFFPISLFRWIVMRTSKIPQWPQWVEDECAIDPDDPWVRDGRHRG